MNFNPFEKMYWRVNDNVRTKDLELLGLSPHDTVIIDDNHKVWNVTPDNVIVIRPYCGPRRSDYSTDNELLKILDILKEINMICAESPDLINDIIKAKNIEYQKTRTDIHKSIIETFIDHIVIIEDDKIKFEQDDIEYWKKYDRMYQLEEWYT
jgi:hypothetical protein